MRSCFFMALLLGTLCFAGCGGEKVPDGMPELFDFTVVVTQDGKPLDGAMVILEDPKGKISYGVTAITDSSGKAKMTTGQWNGAPAGEYNVAVRKDVGTESKYGNVEPSTDTARAQWRANRKSEYRPTHRFVDDQFRDAATSGLTVSITGAGEATVDVSPAVDNVIIPDDSAPEPTDGAPAEAPVEE